MPTLLRNGPTSTSFTIPPLINEPLSRDLLNLPVPWTVGTLLAALRSAPWETDMRKLSALDDLEPALRSLRTGHAANEDDLNDAESKDNTARGAWDAYDVWRIFIKEARDSREQVDR